MIFKPDNFEWSEFVSSDVWMKRGEKVCELFTPEILKTLDEIRKEFGCSITVNNWSYGGRFSYRGFREMEYYSNQGKRSLSQHLRGNAFDFDVKGFSAEESRVEIRDMKKEGKLQHLTGMEIGVNWVHIDCRQTNRLNENGLFEFNS